MTKKRMRMATTVKLLIAQNGGKIDIHLAKRELANRKASLESLISEDNVSNRHAVNVETAKKGLLFAKKEILEIEANLVAFSEEIATRTDMRLALEELKNDNY